MKKILPRSIYDEKSDSLYIVLSDGAQEGFIELAPNINLEIGAKGRIVGIEVLEASKVLGQTSKPMQILKAAR